MAANGGARLCCVTQKRRRPMISMQLKTARKLAGLTQQELATRAGVDDTFISVVENGKRDIHAVGYATVVRLARALGVEPEELFPVPEEPALIARAK
jgi:transcriptional regulator with XRE-family HTH domain